MYSPHRQYLLRINVGLRMVLEGTVACSHNRMLIILYVVLCRRNKSVEFTLAFSLRSIFFRFLAGEMAFPHQDAQTSSGPQPSVYSVGMGVSFIGGKQPGGLNVFAIIILALIMSGDYLCCLLHLHGLHRE